MSTRLTNKIELGQIGELALDYAKVQAEEALTRTIVALDASKEEIKNVAIAGAKVAIAQFVKNQINNNLVDVIADVYAAVQVTKGGYNLYKGINNFNEAYSECTDEDVAAVLAKLSGEESEEDTKKAISKMVDEALNK